MQIRQLLLTALLLLFPAIAYAAAPCFPTAEYGGGKTAAVVNPTAPVTGDIDATDCDFGVYFGLAVTRGLVQNAKIHGALTAGVAVRTQGDSSVDIVWTSIYDIGMDQPGDTGVAIWYAPLQGSLTGKIVGNYLSRYRSVGIWVAGTQAVQITDNIVSGLGSTSISVQYGIFMKRGTRALIARNTVIGHSSLGGGIAPGIYVEAGEKGDVVTDTEVTQNVALNNDIGIAVDNASGTTPTRNTIADNHVACDAVYNTVPYQIGITVSGYRDKVVSNQVSGPGYDPETLPGFTFDIDLTGAIAVKLKPPKLPR